jgi:hypothetical protein
MVGLPPETLRIASQTLDYLELNAQPMVHPDDEFLSSFSKEEVCESVIDDVQTNIEEEAIQELQEVVDVEDDKEELMDYSPVPQLYSRILSDMEKRKMEKVQKQADKEAEKERKRIEKAALRAEKEKEREEKKLKNGLKLEIMVEAQPTG